MLLRLSDLQVSRFRTYDLTGPLVEGNECCHSDDTIWNLECCHKMQTRRGKRQETVIPLQCGITGRDQSHMWDHVSWVKRKCTVFCLGDFIFYLVRICSSKTLLSTLNLCNCFWLKPFIFAYYDMVTENQHTCVPKTDTRPRFSFLLYGAPCSLVYSSLSCHCSLHSVYCS